MKLLYTHKCLHKKEVNSQVKHFYYQALSGCSVPVYVLLPFFPILMHSNPSKSGTKSSGQLFLF